MELIKKILRFILRLLENKQDKPLKGKVICVDPGHGGNDSGAVGGNSKEKDIVLNLGFKLKKSLVSAGAEVVMTREGDVKVGLSDRVDKAVSHSADLFLSVHCNGFNDELVRGVETFVHPQASKDSKDIAIEVQSKIMKSNDTNNRGVKRKNLYVLRETPMPAILVEYGFITNPEEEKKLLDPEHRDMLAEATKDGLISFYNK